MLSVDVNNLENKVKPILRNGKKYLDDAKRYLNIASIPGDFTYASRLKRIPAEIFNIQTRIYSIEKWMDQSVNSFKNLENKNKNLVNSINASTKGMATSLKSAKIRQAGSGTVVDENAVNVKIANNIVNTTKNTVYNILSYKENNAISMKDVMKATSAQAVKSVANSMSKSMITGTYIAGGVESTIVDNVINAIDKVGCVVSDTIDLVKDGASKAWNWTKEKASDAWDWAKEGVSSVWNWAKDGISDAWDWTKSAVKKTIASVANVFIGVLKGLNSLVEAFTDIIAIVGTGVASIATGIYDGITYGISSITGDTDDWSSTTKGMWKGVMGYVAENQTENKFKNFYQNNKVGQWLDDNAIDLCKSDGLITNIASGLGYVSGIIALTVATGGLGGLGILSSAAVSAGYATAAGAGKYTAESWEKARDSSWEGIERMKDKGEISQEQYDSFVAIRGFSDEQWEAIKADFDSGNITEEMYNQMKQIREMPDDWRTLENGIKGIIYGAANGVWEGIQYYVGAKLAGTVINGASSMTNSAVRVSADTAFNALDTPYRTLVDALVHDKSLEQSWMEQGAWKSVLTSVGVGLIGSIGGETINLKTKKVNSNENIDVNIIDPEHGFQLNTNDLGDFFKAKLRQGFFTEEEMSKILNNINSKGFLDENTGKFLKGLFDDDSQIFVKTIHSKDLESIMQNGIYCNGNAASRMNNVNSTTRNISDIDLGNTVTDVTGTGLLGLVDKLKGANGFSQGGNAIDGAMIVKVPKGTSLEDMLKYNSELGVYSIDPKYNVGFIGCDSNGVLDSSRIIKQANSSMSGQVTSNIDVNTNTINFDEQIELANYHTMKGRFYGISVDSLDQIPKDLFDRIENPESVFFFVKGEKVSFVNAKYPNGLPGTINSRSELTIEQKIADAKYHTNKERIYELKVNSLDELPPNFLEEFDNPNALIINVNGKIYNYTNFHELNTSSSTIKKKNIENGEVNLNNEGNDMLENAIEQTGAKQTSVFKTITKEIPLSMVGIYNKIFKESLSKNISLKNKALKEGILHFTSENSVDAIISSGYVKKTGAMMSYGKPSSFFFAGTPSVGDVALNLDKIEKKMTAVRIKTTEDVLDNFRYRFKDDQALLWNGEFKFKDMGLQAEKAYFVLDKVNRKLQYKEVSKEIFDTFDENLLPVQGKMLSSLYSLKVGLDHQMDLIKANKARTVTSRVNELFN